jgi:hypothetical protein
LSATGAPAAVKSLRSDILVSLLYVASLPTRPARLVALIIVSQSDKQRLRQPRLNAYLYHPYRDGYPLQPLLLRNYPDRRTIKPAQLGDLQKLSYPPKQADLHDAIP